MVNKIGNIITKIEVSIVCLGLSVLIITVFLAAILRFFGIDMSVSTDLAQLVFSWVSFIGAALAMKHNRHMGVDMLVEKFPIKTRNLIALSNSILILIFLLFVIYNGINLSIINAARKYNTLNISYSFATISCPIGCILMSITVVNNIISYIKNIITNDYSSLNKGASTL